MEGNNEPCLLQYAPRIAAPLVLHSSQQHALRLLCSDASLTLVCGRRWGKTTLLALDIALRVLFRPATRLLICAPTHEQALRTFAPLVGFLNGAEHPDGENPFDLLHGDGIVRHRVSKTVRVSCHGVSDRLRGLGATPDTPDLRIYVDERGHVADAHMEAVILPMLASVARGALIQAGTPTDNPDARAFSRDFHALRALYAPPSRGVEGEGRGSREEVVGSPPALPPPADPAAPDTRPALDTPATDTRPAVKAFGFARGSVQLPQGGCMHAPTSENPRVSPAFLAAQKARLPPDVYAREYDALFPEHAGGGGVTERDADLFVARDLPILPGAPGFAGVVWGAGGAATVAVITLSRGYKILVSLTVLPPTDASTQAARIASSFAGVPLCGAGALYGDMARGGVRALARLLERPLDTVMETPAVRRGLQNDARDAVGAGDLKSVVEDDILRAELLDRADDAAQARLCAVGLALSLCPETTPCAEWGAHRGLRR